MVPNSVQQLTEEPVIDSTAENGNIHVGRSSQSQANNMARGNEYLTEASLEAYLAFSDHGGTKVWGSIKRVVVIHKTYLHKK